MPSRTALSPHVSSIVQLIKHIRVEKVEKEAS